MLSSSSVVLQCVMAMCVFLFAFLCGIFVAGSLSQTKSILSVRKICGKRIVQRQSAKRERRLPSLHQETITVVRFCGYIVSVSQWKRWPQEHREGKSSTENCRTLKRSVSKNLMPSFHCKAVSQRRKRQKTARHNLAYSTELDTKYEELNAYIEQQRCAAQKFSDALPDLNELQKKQILTGFHSGQQRLKPIKVHFGELEAGHQFFLLFLSVLLRQLRQELLV